MSCVDVKRKGLDTVVTEFNETVHDCFKYNLRFVKTFKKKFKKVARTFLKNNLKLQLKKLKGIITAIILLDMFSGY